MNRLDRLFAMTTYLQGRGRVRADDLAHRFEVSKRTVYRDIAAMAEAGIPVVSLPGQGYELASGYFLPPLVFSPAEASALLLGARLLASQASGAIAAAADGAVAKVAAVLDDAARRRANDLDDTVRFLETGAPHPPLDLADPRVTALRAAIAQRRVVALRYRGPGMKAPTERRVEPRVLAFGGNTWYLAAYCRLRGGERAFRLDRIERLVVTEEPFRPRPEEPSKSSPTIEVRVRFSAETAQHARERQHWSFVREEEEEEGCWMSVYAPRRTDEIASWLLGWGAGAEVLAPPVLRASLRVEALRLAEMLT